MKLFTLPIAVIGLILVVSCGKKDAPLAEIEAPMVMTTDQIEKYGGLCISWGD